MVSLHKGGRCWSEYPGWERAWLCSHFVSKCSHHFSVAFRMELQETLQRDGSHVDTRAPQREVHHSFHYFHMPRLRLVCVLAGLINQCNGYTGSHPEEFYSLHELYIFLNKGFWISLWSQAPGIWVPSTSTGRIDFMLSLNRKDREKDVNLKSPHDLRSSINCSLLNWYQKENLEKLDSQTQLLSKARKAYKSSQRKVTYG